MEGPAYIFLFRNKTFDFYRVDIDNLVSVSPVEYILKSSPAGWDEITIENIRNKMYWGLDRQVSAKLDFVNDGGLILKDTFYRSGTEADSFLVIRKQELDYQAGVSYRYFYRQIFAGPVDFTTFSHDGPKVNVRTLEDGLPKYIKANENTIFEFPMNVAPVKWVKMDGIRLHEKLNYGDTSNFDISRNFYGLNFFGPCFNTGSEGDHYNVLVESEFIESVGGIPFADKVQKDNIIIQNLNDTPVVITISGVLEFICIGMTSSPAYGLRTRFLTSTQTVSNQSDYDIYTSPAMVVGTTYTQAYSLTITLQPNEKLFRESIFVGAAGSDAIVQFTDNSKFDITFITRRPATYVPHLTGEYLFNNLCLKITDGVFGADVSPLLTTYKDILFTCGNAIRGILDGAGNTAAVMQLSFSDFFKFWDCFHSAGVVERNGDILLDTKGGLVEIQNYIDLGSPAYTPKIAFTKDYSFNEVEIGYPEISSEVGAMNGNEEFNSRVRFSLGTTNDTGKLDKVSKIKASCYEQEKIRTTLFQKDTTDNKNDNDIYANYCGDTLQAAAGSSPAHYLLDRSLNAGATGLIEPSSIWNLRLSPKRMLLNNGAFLRSSKWKCDALILKYVSADRNNKVVAGGVTEKANVTIGSLAAPFFNPILIEADFAAPFNLIELIDSNPLQVYRFFFRGEYWFGIANKVSVSPSSNKLQSYQLLSVPTNNFIDLINYFG